MIVATIAGGEIGTELGIFRSMIPAGRAHGVAAIEAAITVIVIMLVARGRRDTELAEARAKESEERFRALVQHASDAILVVEDSGRVKYASPAVEHVLGCAPEDLESFDTTWVDPDHADAVIEAWLRLRSPASRTGGTSSSGSTQCGATQRPTISSRCCSTDCSAPTVRARSPSASRAS